MRIESCYFCSQPCYPSKGITFVRNDARVFKFCRSKCHKNLKWTKAFRKAAGKEMVVDSTLSFASRRNVPTRYNRDLVATTLKAMTRVSEIRARRERVFYKNRMAGNKERNRLADHKLVAENQHLLPKTMRMTEKMDVEEMVVEQQEQLQQTQTMEGTKQPKQRNKTKQKLLVGGGVEEERRMDID
ncbi:MAG: ATPase-activating ribosome biosynthesis protein [Watsoniomyces obsoletus]|nr:MAG: ATPase-activating ribosome biosynthesis protein [Watsoniomyces obsoletus]